MHPDRVERLRLEYTDQYVVVEGDRPQLVRYRGKVGQVRTINANGRALVEFESDRGRYDLELDYLKVVDKPKPKEPPAKEAKAKPAASEQAAPSQPPSEPKTKLSELELARQQKDAEKPKPIEPSSEPPREPEKSG
ncbi:MAG: hypothetical protein GXX96_10590 [Planctomycetaceae bacterium]|nr:hypothetical protein [Planctomycetaceae bacterium]